MPNDRNDRRNQIQRMNPAELGLPTKPVDDLDLVADSLEHARGQGCNVLAPLTRLSYLPPSHVISLRVVLFDSTFTKDDNFSRSNGTFYKVEGGKLALHRSALDLLAAAAGISSVPRGCKVEQRATHYWHATHTIRMKGFDGQTREITRSCEVDLRDGSSEIEAMIDQAKKKNRDPSDQIRNARKFGPRNAESKAANRAIRAALGLKGGYSAAEAARPFVFPCLIWRPDLDDPEIRRMVAARELGIVEEVYGPTSSSTAPILAAPEDVLDAGAARPQLTDRADADEIERMEVQGDTREREPAWFGDDPDWQEREPECQERRAPAPERRRDPAQEQRGAPPCNVCGRPLSDKVAGYSADKYGEPLCWDHQQEAERGGR